MRKWNLQAANHWSATGKILLWTTERWGKSHKGTDPGDSMNRNDDTRYI